MRVRVSRPRGVAAVYDQRDASTVELHKYSVVRDGRRQGVEYGKHGTGTSLRGVVLRFEIARTFMSGHLVSERTQPDKHANEELRERGARVIDADAPDVEEATA